MEEQDYDELLDLYISAQQGWSSMDWISSLPDDLLLNIISRVHFVETVESVSLVSKCFYHLTQESALWKSHYLSVFGSLERTKGSNWLAKFTERWQVRMKLKNYHIRSHTLSPYPLEFDLVDIFGNFVAAHSNSDFIALDIVHLWDLRKDKPYALSPSSEALPTALKLSSKYLAVGLTTGEAQIYHVHSKDLIHVFPRAPKGTPVTCMEFHPYGGLLFGHQDGLLSCWNGKEDVCYRKRAHDKPVHTIFPGLEHVYTFSLDGVMKWGLKPFEVLAGDRHPIEKVVVVENDVITIPDPSGVYVDEEVSERLTGYFLFGGHISIWDLEKFEMIWKFSPFDENLAVIPGLEEVLVDNGRGHVRLIEDVVVLEDWIVVQANIVQSDRQNLLFVNKRTKTLHRPLLASAANIVGMLRYDRWHVFTWNRSLSMSIWCGNELIRIVPGRFLGNSALSSAHLTNAGFAGRTPDNLIDYEWAKPTSYVTSEANADICLQRLSKVPERYFPPEDEARGVGEKQEKREREGESGKQAKERKKQKLYDFWK